MRGRANEVENNPDLKKKHQKIKLAFWVVFAFYFIFLPSEWIYLNVACFALLLGFGYAYRSVIRHPARKHSPEFTGMAIIGAGLALYRLHPEIAKPLFIAVLVAATCTGIGHWMGQSLGNWVRRKSGAAPVDHALKNALSDSPAAYQRLAERLDQLERRSFYPGAETFDLFLKDDGGWPFTIASIIANNSDLTPVDAQNRASSAPATILQNLSWEEATKIRMLLEAHGADVEIQPIRPFSDLTER